ncbi:MAG: NADH-quinone oxidoreductase subunit G [Pseudomonadota bacterium]|nr:NADH-quinone oxidoreductase subunit G [Pseudomonadota bacterium]
MAHIEINGNKLEVEDGSSIIDAADALGIYIPRFCYHKKLSVAANCRMCLVEIENNKKPMPACATPVLDGMKVTTQSRVAVKAQQGVMEFLLINHPLDCPICDQGGECELQDLAVGYGAPASRYSEAKRVVVNKNLGSLISTDMTRCIHCTRCVRFGEEIGGIMELGMTGRGEHAEIGTYVQKAVGSELSGNMIDLCPVGALTNKPFRYSARTWELLRRPGVSPHDALGSNLTLHVKQNQVMRVLPRENESINECWISDRDRYGYEGLNSDDRLKSPMIRQDGKWKVVDWSEALEYVVHGLKDIRDIHGPDSVGMLVSQQSTLEEAYLAQKFVRGLGTSNIDSRLRQSDFSLDGHESGITWLGMPVEEVGSLDAILLVGALIRREQPLFAHRIRDVVKAGGKLMQVTAIDEDHLVPLHASYVVSPAHLVHALAEVALALSETQNVPLDSAIQSRLSGIKAGKEARAIVQGLVSGKRQAILLGGLAITHPAYATLRALAQDISRLSGARLGILPVGANSVGCEIAGAIPHHGPLATAVSAGMNALQMLDSHLRAYILLHAEPGLDFADAGLAMHAFSSADMVVRLTSYVPGEDDPADVVLPVSPFSETSGAFVNMAGQLQCFNAVVKPFSETRPAWKVLRVLGNLFDLDGFDFDSSEAIRHEMAENEWQRDLILNNKISALQKFDLEDSKKDALIRIADVPMYATDAIIRRATSLQKTPEAKRANLAWMNAKTASSLSLKAGDTALLQQKDGTARLMIGIDEGIPTGCVRVAQALESTLALHDPFGEIVVSKHEEQH